MPALLIPLAEIVAALVALALCWMARSIAAPIVNVVGKELGWLNRGVAWLTNRFIDLGIELTKNIAPVFFDGVGAIVGWLHSIGQFSEYTAHAIERSAVTLSKFSDWVVTTYIPNHAKAIVSHVTQVTLTQVHRIALSKAQLVTLEHQLDGYIHRAIAATIPGVVPKAWPRINWTPKRWREWLGLAAGAGALALPGSLAWERELSKELHKGLTSVEKRLRSVEKVLGATGAAAVVTYGLAKIGLGWMTRCTNLRHIGKSFCGADLSALIGLFGALAIIEGKFSIVEIAEGMLAVEKDMVSLIAGAFSELDGIAS